MSDSFCPESPYASSNDWRQQGRLSLFTAKQWKGFARHLTGDATGYASLGQLLKSMLVAPRAVSRAISLKPLADHEFTKQRGYRSIHKLRITFLPDEDRTGAWEWNQIAAKEALLCLGRTMMSEFLTCVEKANCEDFGIGFGDTAESAKLWFWRTMLP